MTRCQSWRRGTKPHSTLHHPGKCHKCWRPCRQRVDGSCDRCSDCTEALVHAPEAWVRLTLISEESPEPGVIDALIGDGDMTVNYTARWQRAHQGSSMGSAVATAQRAAPAPTMPLRESIVASVQRESEGVVEPMAPRYADEDGDEW